VTLRKIGPYLQRRTYLVSTTVVEVVVCGDGRNEVNAQFVGSRFDLWHVIWVDSCSFLGRSVYAEIRIVIFPHRNVDNVHVSERGDREISGGK
jgi:hypothetical protein